MEKFNFWYWDNLLNQDQIKQINLICEKHHDPSFKDSPADNTIKTADVKLIKWEFLKPVIHHVDDSWRASNAFSFGFNIFQTSDIDRWNFNTYDSINSGEYDWHYDASPNYVNDVKLTGIVNISDEPYEGGELMVFYDGDFQEIPQIKEPGGSILLRGGILHKVNPVTKGKRKTLSYWFMGPRFI